MIMNKEDAKKIAVEYIGRQESNGFKLNLISIDESKNSSKYWAAIFEVKTEEGYIVDGPIVILVNDETGEADSLQTVIEKEFMNN